MTGYSDVKQILDAAVGGPGAAVGGPHGPFWRSRTRDQFVSFSIFGLPVVTLGDGDGSTIVKALRGQAPFGQDTGTPGASFRRMPAGRPPVPPDQIAVIADWITNGAPEIAQPPLGPLEIRLEGSASGQAFLIVSDDVHAATAQLTVRTTDGSEGDVSLRVRAGSGTTISLSSATVHVSGTASAVSVVATSASAAPNDTAIEILQGPTVLAQFELTVAAAPSLRFSGRFQCRLATDPDDYDDPWGHQSSFGVYAVQGPDPANPDEPPLDRIVRFHDAVAVRPFCGPVGVLTVAVEAQVGGQTLRFTDGDASIGQSVRLGPECVFDSRNRTFAPD
ncbi:MAG TPA: hypothetical protein VHN80_12870, partial [Kineosporiaceae bacterium]|nr:hypothetical protein [Kineosporiaceae bacterium]